MLILPCSPHIHYCIAVGSCSYSDGFLSAEQGTDHATAAFVPTDHPLRVWTVVLELSFEDLATDPI